MTLKLFEIPALTRRAVPKYWDAIAFAIIIAIFVAVAQGARGMVAPLSPVETTPLSLVEALFAPHADIVDIRAMDLFVCRFAPDENWTASLIGSLPERPAVVQKLKEMEDSLCRLPGWIDHGTHVLIAVQPRTAADRSQAELREADEGVSVVASFADFLAKRSR